MTTQKATYNASAKTKFTSSHRKENKCYLTVYQILVRDSSDCRGRMHTPVELRLYGTGNTNTACLWINHGEIHTQGSGRAGGYGYHRPSAAAAEAISNAGFSLSRSIGGVGDSAIEEALIAIAEAIGVKDYGLTVAHA
jgi:hypothetical protein